MRVLIIEDDEGLRKSFEMIIKNEGHVVFVWPSGEQALNLVETWKPDFVLTDHNLGSKETGLDIAVSLKDKGIPVMLMSGDTSMADLAKSRDIPFSSKLDTQRILSAINEVNDGQDSARF